MLFSRDFPGEVSSKIDLEFKVFAVLFVVIVFGVWLGEGSLRIVWELSMKLVLLCERFSSCSCFCLCSSGLITLLTSGSTLVSIGLDRLL
jgi:hypothetical protein